MTITPKGSLLIPHIIDYLDIEISEKRNYPTANAYKHLQTTTNTYKRL